MIKGIATHEAAGFTTMEMRIPIEFACPVTAWDIAALEATIIDRLMKGPIYVDRADSTRITVNFRRA